MRGGCRQPGHRTGKDSDGPGQAPTRQRRWSVFLPSKSLTAPDGGSHKCWRAFPGDKELKSVHRMSPGLLHEKNIFSSLV